MCAPPGRPVCGDDAVLVLLAALCANVAATGCFVASAGDDANVSCTSAADCPPSHRCDLGLSRCLLADETAPEARPQTVGTREDEPVMITLDGVDFDGDRVAFDLTDPDPAEGSIDAAEPGIVVFSPAPDFHGTATFSFSTVDPSGLRSAAATVTVLVEPVDDPPSFVAPDRLFTEEDQILPLDIELFDRPAADRDADTIQIIDVDSEGPVIEVRGADTGAVVNSQPDGDQTYRPAPDMHGADTVEIVVVLDGVEVRHALAIVVQPVNDPPTLDVGDLSTIEGEPVAVPVVIADIDDPVDTLTITITEPPAASVGVVDIDTTVQPPLLRFTPAPGFVGDAAATIAVADAGGKRVEGLVDIQVFPFVAAPHARSASVEVDEDDVLPIDLAELSVGPADLQWRIQSAPQHGTLDTARLAAGQVLYRPGPDYAGPDVLVFSVNVPGSATDVVGTINILVQPRPDPPTAADLQLTLQEDRIVSGRLAALDPDGEDLTTLIEVPPSHGTIDFVGLDFIYEPMPNHNGRDEVDVVVRDAMGAQARARLTFQIDPVPDAPVAQAASHALDEDVPLALRLGAQSVDEGATFRFVLTRPPERGVLQIAQEAQGDATYVPHADSFGADSFEFVVLNAVGMSSAPTTVALTVRPVNDPPVLTLTTTATGLEDSVLRIPFDAEDVDDATLTFSIGVPPLHGAAAIDAAHREVVFTPAVDFFGADAFELSATDASGATSPPVRIALTILPAPDAPTGVPMALTVREDTAVPFALAGTTPDGADVDFFLVTPPAHGAIESFEPATGIGLYRPVADHVGADGFTFGVRDAAGLTSAVPTAVAIDVIAVDDPPQLSARESFVTHEDTPALIAIPASDPDGDLVTVTVAMPDRGTIQRLGPTTFRYDPPAEFFGDVAVTATATDAQGHSAVATYAIQVLAVADTPVALPVEAALDEETATGIQLLGHTVDEDQLRFVLDTPPAAGTLLTFGSNTGSLVYLAPPDFEGVDTLSYRVVNAAGVFSAPAMVTILIRPINDAPVLLGPTTVELLEDGFVHLRLEAVDPDPDDQVQIELVVAPQHGTVGSGPFTSLVRLRYEPDPDHSGADLLTLRAVDSRGATSSDLTVVIDVKPVADPPVAQSQTIATVEDAVAAFALTGTTVDGGPLRFTITRLPQRGAIEGFDPVRGTGTYRPRTDDNGVDQFGFVAIDERGVVGGEATVRIAISPENDAPVVVSSPVVAIEDVPRTIVLTVLDPEGDPTTLEIVTNGTKGTATVVAPNTLQYVPLANVNGTDTLVVRARDATAIGPRATLEVAITPVPDPPTAQPVSIQGNEDETIIVQLAGQSNDGETVTFLIVSPPVNGRVTSFNDRTGVIVYEGEADFHGEDSLVFAVRSATQFGTATTASVTVLPVNDAPTLTVPTTPVDVPRFGVATTTELEVDDVDGDRPSLVIVGAPAFGQAQVVTKGIRLAAVGAPSNFVGIVEVDVAAVDGKGGMSAPAPVRFRVVVDDDCAALRNSGVDASGVHLVNGTEARCDMVFDGGGWTMVAKIVSRWSYSDTLWTSEPLLNRGELDPTPDVDAKFDVWSNLPAPTALRLETFNGNLADRQVMIVELDGTAPLTALFADAAPMIPTGAGIVDWRQAFPLVQPSTTTPVCAPEGLNVGFAIAESVQCRLCAVVGTFARVGDPVCRSLVEAHGLGIRGSLQVHAGGISSRDLQTRRVIVWARNTDFTASFPDAKNCEAHAAAGRTVPGEYLVGDQPAFCSF
jgi:hypothetical protein